MFKTWARRSLDSIQKQLEPHIINLGNKNIKKIEIVLKSCLLTVVMAESLRGIL